MHNKKNLSTVLVVIILIGAFLVLRAAIVGQLSNNIKDADFEEDALKAATCTPPTVSNIQVSNISATGATVTWTTNQQSTSAVRLGTTSNSMTWLATMDTPAATSGVTAHSYTLSGLSSARTYYYRIRSSNGTCQKTSTTNSFSTLSTSTGNPDTTAPTTPTNMSAVNTTSTSTTIQWNGSTDPTVTGSLTSGVRGYEVYGPNSACNVNGSAGYCGNVLSSGTGIQSLVVSGLSPATTYTGNTGNKAGFAVKAYDNAGNYSTSTPRLTVLTMTTTTPNDLCLNIAGIQDTIPAGLVQDSSGNCVTPPDTSAPSTPTGVSMTAKTSTSISIAWNASTDNVGVAGYRIYINGQSTPVNASLVAGTAYTINALSPNTAYSITVKAVDAANNTSSPSTAFSITTDQSVTLDVTAPTRPTGLSATNITSTSFTLNWTASTDDVLTPAQIHYDVYGPSGVCNVGGIANYCGAVTGSTSMAITGLAAGTTYSALTGANAGFVVQSYDDTLHYSTGSNLLSVTTIAGADTTPPVISNVQVTTTATYATITWTTNEASNTYVEFGPTTAYGLNASNASMITSHSQAITGLTSGNTYNYRVKSTDAAGNTATSGNYNFVASASGGGGGTACTSPIPLGEQRQMWVWNDGGIVVADVINTSKAASQTFFDYVDSHKVTVAYIQMNPGWFTATNSANLKNFLNVARDQHCLQIEALSGGSDWASPYYDSVSAPSSTANVWAQQVAAFNNSITGTNAKLLGLQYDVEPYLHSWSSTNDAAGIATNTRTINGLIDMLAQAKTTISGSGLMLDLAPPRWYDTQFALVPNVFIRRGFTTPQNKSAMKYLMDVVDIYTVQDYVVTGPTIYADGLGEVTYGNQTGKKVRIGVEVGAGYGNGTSFADSPNPTCANLNAQLADAFSRFSSAGVTGGFDGFAIEYYPTWKIMCNY
jgi:chitodextrinase